MKNSGIKFERDYEMRIEVKAKLILTVPEPKQNEFAGDFVLAAEQQINDKAALVVMPKTKTKVGIRIHVDGEVPKVIG